MRWMWTNGGGGDALFGQGEGGRFKEKRWDSRRMLSSGGMPSSHSATVTALAMAIGLQEGTGGSAFAIALVLACVLLNQIVIELPPEHPLSNVRPLRDSLGHTPVQNAVTLSMDLALNKSGNAAGSCRCIAGMCGSIPYEKF
ncbi:hypothetical protein RJ640_004745 [Escallonia rubra]|uniref:Acid phosphatase/vanadium-dependent haloperoxidase-related protein n=1 Tax=Escallonia rubra TaxID=112253 RepID=A0AA88RCQ0_9ASTE|nr:hypothetical protein RJ640_004745 [Escallonia rubra]